MKAHLAPKKSVQVNKITSSCEICSGPHDTHYCMENPKQAFVDYASSCTDEAGGKWFTFKHEQNNLGLVSNFMASQDARLSEFEVDFKQQQGELTNKIDTDLKAITDRITRALPSNTVKNPKLNVNSTSPVLSARSYPVEDPQCSARIYNWINAITIYPKKPSKPHDDKPGENEIAKTGATDEDHHAMVRVESEHKKSEEEEREEEGNTENINTDSPSQPDPLISFIT
ncbi:hypothetical protein Tco_0468882 [Tanacetum coccineum]